MLASDQNNQRFQPGQLGLRHLLGVTAVVCIVAGLSAARLRTLPAMRAAEVVVHWVIVALIAAAMNYRWALRRRRERIAAGPVLLRVSRRPVARLRGRIMAWLLLVAVIADGVFMTVVALPSGLFNALLRSPLNLVYLLLLQGLLWAYSLDHWMTNVYWVEFCEHGVLTYDRYYPWESIRRLGWSPAQPGNLLISSGGYVREWTIEPAARAAVRELLASRAATISQTLPAVTTRE